MGPRFPGDPADLADGNQEDYSARLAADPETLSRILKPIAEAGVDIFHCSQRRYWDVEFASWELNFAGWVKRVTGKPTITVGSVGLAGPLSVTELGASTEPSANLPDLALECRAR